MTSVLSFIAGERQDAVSADMRRFYGVPLHHAVNTWTAADLSSAVRNLPEDSATVRAEMGDMHGWDHTSANLAELVDLMHYWLHSEYAKWIYDPDDPANRYKSKVKPPPEPIIPPIAFRPESVTEARVREYADRVAEFSEHAGPPAKKWVSSDDFDAAIDEM